MRVVTGQLPAEDLVLLETLRQRIDARLNAFAAVPVASWAREIAFCLLTPQSSALHAEACIADLDSRGFFQGRAVPEVDIAGVLREPSRYVRFHHTKARRLICFQPQIPDVVAFLAQGQLPEEEREYLRLKVNGLGLKESSHALRNIGRRGLGILDRHILRNLLRCGAIKKIPASLTEPRYREIESAFKTFSNATGVDMDVLDLFFWAREAGEIFK
jgi:N-glycosylase/DNA lyase